MQICPLFSPFFLSFLVHWKDYIYVLLLVQYGAEAIGRPINVSVFIYSHVQ